MPVTRIIDVTNDLKKDDYCASKKNSDTIWTLADATQSKTVGKKRTLMVK